MGEFLKNLSKHSDILIAFGVIGILLIMILPIPAFMLDILLAGNIALSIMILMVTMYMTKPLEFSVFPGLLLVITLFRLALNVASTRLILGDAYGGEVIKTFGTFVVKGNYVVGFIVFIILVIIQFVVITKGATRIAEVAARFTLDAMPGKQMSIDADLNAGLINEQQARKRREEISREADFYGAMDGASKFVRGDAIAGIIITLVNIIGGFIIGILSNNMSFLQSLQTYTLLTVGDGLVTQMPALMISTASGIIVTRAASESNLGRDIIRQLTQQPRAIVIASILLLFLSIIPGMPTIPFMSLSFFIGSVGYFSMKAAKEKVQAEQLEKEIRLPEVPEKIEDLLKVDPMEIEIGYALIPLVDNSQGGDLLERIAQIRKQLATELGIIVPPIRIRDNIQLEPEHYRIKIRGIQVAKGQLMPESLMAMAPNTIEEEVPGFKTSEPAFGLPATWIDKSQKEYAEMLGYTVVESSAVLATHISEIIKNNSSTILNRQQVKELLDNLKKENSTLIDDIVPNLMSVGSIQKVMQNLLREQIPVRDLETILECLADYAVLTKDVDILTEYVRTALNRTITHLYRSDKNEIKVVTVDPKLEKIILDIMKNPNFSGRVVLPPLTFNKLQQDLSKKIKQMLDVGFQPIILCSPAIRFHFRRLIEETFPSVIVLSFNEVANGTSIISVGMVSGG